MSNELWGFVRQTGLEGCEIGFLVSGPLVLIWAILQAYASLKTNRNQLTYGDIFVPIGLFGFAALLFFMLWLNIRERYLLQPGKGHYTVGTVYQHKWQKGQQKYLLEYYVSGRRLKKSEFCGIENNQNVPCPPLGSRRYVYFAPADPNTAQITAVPVPDSVRVVPPEGWAKLP